MVPMSTNILIDAGRWWTVQRGAGPVWRPRSTTGMSCGRKSPRRWRLSEDERLARGGSVHRPGDGRCPDAHHRPSFALRIRPQPRGDRAVYRTPRAELGPGRVERAPAATWWSVRWPSMRLIMRCSASCSTASRAAHRRFVLIDVHSYNHRRDGPDGGRRRRRRRPTSTSAPSRCRASTGPSCSTR